MGCTKIKTVNLNSKQWNNVFINTTRLSEIEVVVFVFPFSISPGGLQ